MFRTLKHVFLMFGTILGWTADKIGILTLSGKSMTGSVFLTGSKQKWLM